MPMNPVVHAAERAAFSKALDAAIHAVRGKGPEKMAENAVRLVNLAQPLLSRRFPKPTGMQYVPLCLIRTANGCSLPTGPSTRSTRTF